MVFLAPFVFIVLTSLMTEPAGAHRATCGPNSWHPDNYVKVFKTAPLRPLPGATRCSTPSLATVFMLVSQHPGGLRAGADPVPRARTVAFLLVITMMMLPPQVTAGARST